MIPMIDFHRIDEGSQSVCYIEELKLECQDDADTTHTIYDVIIESRCQWKSY